MDSLEQWTQTRGQCTNMACKSDWNIAISVDLKADARRICQALTVPEYLEAWIRMPDMEGLEVQQDLERVLDDLRGLTAPHVDDEADAAGVVLLTGVVKTLRTGTENRRHCKLPFGGLSEPGRERGKCLEVVALPEIQANGSL